VTTSLGQTAIWGEAPPLRIIPIQSGEGAWNMAVDEALLETTNETGEPILRFYTWSRPVLSLGFFQEISHRQAHPESLPCTLVRRASGGGAIVHDQELTYSLCAPRKLGKKELAGEYYRIIHEVIACILHSEGVFAELVSKSETPSGRIEPFLCFERRSPNDVVANGYKICGSAQRRSDKAVLQHGSLLIRTSRFASTLPGIEQLSSRTIDQQAVVAQLGPSIASRLGSAYVHGNLSSSELSRAGEISATKYGAYAWNAKIRKNA
jgi:lipoate-protein ligase A